MKDQKTVALVSAFALSLVAWSVGYAKRDTDEKQTIRLTGDAVRPNKVTTKATATAVFTWDDHGGISYTIDVKDLSSAPTAIHIHGPADPESTAPKLSSIDIMDSLMTGKVGSGMIGASIFAHFKRDALKDLFDHGKAYVDIHTKSHPDGELRGHFKH